MTVDTASPARRRAAGLSRDERQVTGPLRGYHHETYAFPLAAESGLSGRFTRGKLREPRPGLLWFDRRCFRSEDRLLIALQGRIERIPECVPVEEELFLQGFIEGSTLGSGPVRSRTLSTRHTDQLGQLFRELAGIKVDELKDVERVCELEDKPKNGDTTAFLKRLIHFTEEKVYGRHADQFGTLFEELGVNSAALEGLRTRSEKLTSRPFTLIHGDLHWHNFIVDGADDLWTIDWELAMIGDPLYELATHLHLMRYPQREEVRIARLWRTEVESAHPGCSVGWDEDLPHLLAYKRIQSVFTDVIRTALALGPGPEPDRLMLPRAARELQRVLAAAQDLQSRPNVPTLRQVMSAYTSWFRSSAP
ncbi:phosphotransferase [Streptomyces lunaelactis]|uniref:phosphotransferase n=1 Tax=Streptomyces lunaelactis TaxID=1535768 RepID=UPI001585141E|nr:phosphotransferase [Streptomyces lunaelactis]NUK06209.1 phosphotransferase [Streptomyces lunaelactis]NUK12856.1 phosphotransferase [Streptomyces lunaelactis]NUK20806.1 phosphotransferase [Streptomyces lunaelactis]NUK38320.1 phosphotransferase [Streptomyces lunaelactis]NUK42912.1 phosphotransferase [Streptomyces lunaelactis]